MLLMRRKTTKEERTHHIAGIIVPCDRTMHRVIWDVARVLAEAREQFGLTYDSMAHHRTVETIYDEEDQTLYLKIYAPQQHKEARQTAATRRQEPTPNWLKPKTAKSSANIKKRSANKSETA